MITSLALRTKQKVPLPALRTYMNVLTTWAHPNPDSLNGAIVSAVEKALTDAGHSVRDNDLYRKGFDCCLDMKDFEKWGQGEVPDDVKAEQADVDWADVLAFVYPIWWNERPAKLKGWCDRVFTQPWAWQFTDQGLQGNLGDKKALVITTHGSPKPLYDGLGIDLDAITEPMQLGTLKYCGIDNTKWVRELGVLMQDRDANEAFVKRAAQEAVSFVG